MSGAAARTGVLRKSRYKKTRKEYVGAWNVEKRANKWAA